MPKFDFNNLMRDLDAPDDAPPADHDPTHDRGNDAPGPIDAPERNDAAMRDGQRDFSQSADAGANDQSAPPPTDRTGRADHLDPNDALADLYTPEEQAPQSTGDLKDLLHSRGVINNEQLAALHRVLKQTPGRRVADVLIEMGVEEAAIQQIVAEMSRLPFERVNFEDTDACDFKALKRLGSEYCKTNLLLPLRREGNRLVVGTASPDDVFLLDDVRRRLNVQSIKHVLVTGYDIRGVLETLSESEAEEYDVEELLSDVDEDDVELVKEEKQDSIEEEAESSPVVKYVNHIIQTAMKEGASDIHIEPEEKVLKVRFRIDGVLFEMMNPPKKMHAAITSRLKIMANLDIAERRLPQDGRIRVTALGRKLDLRMSTLPTPNGEKTVMRILDTRSINVTLDNLGFAQDTLELWKKQINQPHGIILVTGPTGSGKTTTLYASLRQLDLRKLNISTVEDPVEYHLSGITQVQVHDRIGMSFAKTLKALLRQDPDVIMLGEIRDMETATIAVQAALTGHLVLSTLHTNDAPSSITRLVNIGIEPFLVGAALNAVLAQRLARRICEHCIENVPLKPEIAEFMAMQGFSPDTVKQGRGCQRCRETGYQGRVGLYEMLVLDDFLRDKIAGNPNVTEFRRMCSERGMVSLRQDGFEKVVKGMTTVEEILRVTQSTV